MRTQHTRIEAPYGGSVVVEHVTMDALIEEWNARLATLGIDPDGANALAARRRLLDLARCIRLSTWGEVYRADVAELEMARVMVDAGFVAEDAPPPRPPESHTVVH